MAFIIKHSQDVKPQKRHVEHKKEENKKPIVNLAITYKFLLEQKCTF